MPIRVVSLLLIWVAAALCGCKAERPANTANTNRNETSPYAAAEAKRSAFFNAIQRGNTQDVERMIAEGFDVNTENEGGVTPLMVASGMNAEVTRVLIMRGARVNAKTAGGYTALMAAALNGQKEVVKLLLDSGADPSAKDASNRTAMNYAEEKKNKEITDLLKQAGAKD